MEEWQCNVERQSTQILNQEKKEEEEEEKGKSFVSYSFSVFGLKFPSFIWWNGGGPFMGKEPRTYLQPSMCSDWQGTSVQHGAGDGGTFAKKIILDIDTNNIL